MSTSSTHDRQRLTTPVQFLKAVGPERAPLLERLKIRTAAHVLFNFPRAYQDLSTVLPIAELAEGVAVSVSGVVQEVDQRTTGSGKQMLGCLIKDETEWLRAMWFNQPFIRKRLQIGSRVMFSGTPKRAGLRWEMVHPRVQNLTDDTVADAGEILPVYPLTDGLKQAQVRRIVKHVLDEYLTAVPEVLPLAFREKYELPGIDVALSQLHFPRDEESRLAAQRRFVFQELLVLQLALAVRRQQLGQGVSAFPLETTAQIDSRIRRLFPFEFTAGQELAIEEVSRDLALPLPMNRLLQGDVGCGKTVVAIYSMLVAVANGCQAALMAPTEVLARQHYETLGKALAQARVRVALWTGGMTAAERRQTLKDIEAGEVDVVVGTQALLHGEYQFPKLGLVIIDEQHKFGVEQRAKLRDAGHAPHYLVMTATPIPRTVAMTAYGDLAVTSIHDLPASRQAVKTYLVEEPRREQWWDFFRKQLREGRQGYVITPRLFAADIDEDEAAFDEDGSPVATVQSLQEAYESLANGELEAFRLDLIHGRMSAAEKQHAMQKFRDGETQVLVATSVIEVGVDVANATVMTIESAERFGLAALHQLRGRVGRGTYGGYVALFCGELSEEQGERMKAFESTADGFELSELDFRLRGPGDLLGTRQHGLPPLRIADLVRDEDVLLEVRAVAQEMVADGRITDDAFQALRDQVITRYGERFSLGDVG